MEPQRRTTRHDIDRGVDLLRAGDVKALYELNRVYLNIDNNPELDQDDRFWNAYALYHFGIALYKYHHHAFALDVFSKCVARFGQDSDEEIAYLVNQALVSSGTILHRSDRFEEAITNFDQVIERLQPATGFKDRAVLAKAVVNRAGSLLKSGAVQEAIAAFDNACARFKDDNDPDVCREIAYASQERARLLGEMKVDDDRSSVQTNASRQGRQLVQQAENAPRSTGVDEVLAMSAEALKLFGENPEGEDRIWAARAMFNRGTALQRAQRNHEAVAGFVAVVERFKHSADEEIRRLVTLARAEAGTASGMMGDFDNALKYLDAAIDGIKNASDRLQRQSLARYMFNRATIFRQAGRIEDAVRAFDAIYDRFAADDDPKVCQFVAMAVYNKATGLRDAGERTRAMTALRFAFDHCAESHDSLIKERGARALFSLAGEHIALDHVEEWAATLHELAVRCGTAAEPAVQEIICKALEVCPVLLTSLPPAAHSLLSDYNRQMFLSILQEFGNRPDVLQTQLEEYNEFLQRTAKHDDDLHARALKVLSAYWVEEKPFAVLLRNFASEAFQVSMPVEGADFPWRGLVQLPIDSAEGRLQAAVGPTIPLISIQTQHLTFLTGARYPSWKCETRSGKPQLKW